MKYLEVESNSIAELKKKKHDITAEIFNLKMKNSIGQVSNPLRIRLLRKDIARIKTAITKKMKI